ncbi:hypothetical protein BX661DRAFT_180233 [Kickxella alabastrina]|uniref:uncharacterized protein n=1 Tax=Kickxella alabastrina TaxID=61397 RepID=UPI0022210118|nr:uncharacterized protein BX661DRAFT_180233 [Kickxella alabastrina]KAI7830877.1 hypothetical protein BX661DRAFT_180233 [Kickxella alabastrina]
MDGVGNSTNEHTDTQVGANMTGAEPHPNSQQAEQTAATEPHHVQRNNGNGSSGANEFSCNICFDTATDPVLTICGHLATCPVCKAGCDKDKVIPVREGPRLNPNMPNRPAGQRPPPPPPRQPSQFFGFDPFGVPGSFHSMGMARTRVGGGGGTVFVGGLGLLPALMGFSTFSGGTAPSNAAPGAAGGTTQPAGQQSFASRVFMMVAAMILMSIIFY